MASNSQPSSALIGRTAIPTHPTTPRVRVRACGIAAFAAFRGDKCSPAQRTIGAASPATGEPGMFRCYQFRECKVRRSALRDARLAARSVTP